MSKANDYRAYLCREGTVIYGPDTKQVCLRVYDKRCPNAFWAKLINDILPTLRGEELNELINDLAAQGRRVTDPYNRANDQVVLDLQVNESNCWVFVACKGGEYRGRIILTAPDTSDAPATLWFEEIHVDTRHRYSEVNGSWADWLTTAVEEALDIRIDKMGIMKPLYPAAKYLERHGILCKRDTNGSFKVDQGYLSLKPRCDLEKRDWNQFELQPIHTPAPETLS